MAKHTNAVWMTSQKYPYGMVRTADKKDVQIFICAEKGGEMHGLQISRRLARMLAKRINQCLDATK